MKESKYGTSMEVNCKAYEQNHKNLTFKDYKNLMEDASVYVRKKGGALKQVR